MPYHVIERPSRTRMARRWIVAGVLVLLGATAAASIAVARPLTVTVDGLPYEVAGGTTVAMLRGVVAFNAPAGDLRDIRGSVIDTGGGSPARVLRNGRAAAEWQRLYPGDVLISRRGQNRIESIEITDVPVPYETIVEGSGTLADVRRAGRNGLRRVVRGAVSGIEIGDTHLADPQHELIVRRSPHPRSKLVALTFDDGPWPTWTEAVLEVLAEHEVPATFFVLGRQAERHPALVKRIADGGHLLGSHSVSHKRFNTVKPARVHKETVQSRRLIADAVGVDSPWIRPPYGAMNAGAWGAVREAGGRVVLWDVDPEDWRKPGTKKIADRVVRATKPGSIVLLHDGGGDRTQTVKALPKIIKRLRGKGYTFVTVEELVEANGVKKGKAALSASDTAQASGETP